MPMQELIATYKQLIDHTLPAAYTYPVRFHHCFGHIILDWLFGGCWYNLLYKNKPAVSQLSEQQLEAAIRRMRACCTIKNC
jgi:hypothetical protein